MFLILRLIMGLVVIFICIYSTSYNDYESYYISSNKLDSGKYTIKIINYYDDYVMGTANLYVVSVPYTAYSVDVSDTSINYGAGGYIYMYITIVQVIMIMKVIILVLIS